MYRYSGLARPRPPFGPHAHAILNASIEVKWTPRKQCDCSFARTPLQLSPGSTVMWRLSLRIQRRVNRQARGRKRHGPELDGAGGRAGGVNPGGRDGKGARERHNWRLCRAGARAADTRPSFRRHVLQDRKRKPHNWRVECTSKQVWSSGYDVSLTR